MPRYSYNSRTPRTDFRGRIYGTASITWDNIAKVYRLKWDWAGQEFIDIIKLAIPASDRSFDPKTKSWFVSESHYDDIVLLFEAKFTNVIKAPKEEVEEQWKGYSIQPAAVDTQKELEVFSSLLAQANIPFDKNASVESTIIQKLYKRAALFYHPDRNPANAELMSKLNAAYQNLKEYFGINK